MSSSAAAAPAPLLLILLLCLTPVLCTDCTDGIIFNTYDSPNVVFLGDTLTDYWVCVSTTKALRLDWLHNGTVIRSFSGSSDTYYWQPITNVNQSGTYTCQVTAANGEICGNKSFSLYVIDPAQIIIPEHQYTFINSSYSLQCSSSVYDIDNVTWSLANSTNATVSSEFSSAQLSDENNYQCTVTILGVSKSFVTSLHVLIRPVILSHPQPIELVIGPNITNFTVTFINYSPNGPRVDWYRNNIPVSADRVITSSSADAISGTTVLQIYRRHDKGSYRVTVESEFGDQLEFVPSNILAQTITEYTFEIDVIVFPAFPAINQIVPNIFNASIYWSHTNVTPDDAPDSIKLILLQSTSSIILQTVNISGDNTWYTLTGLTPATQYSLRMSVANMDRISELSEVLQFNTTTAEPSVQSFTAVRVSANEFNITIGFNYFGAADIKQVRLGYRPANRNTVSVTFIDITSLLSGEGLIRTGVVTIDIVNERLQLSAFVTNTADKSNSSMTVHEDTEPLGAPSSASITSITSDSVTLIIQLPQTGTPPILFVNFSFNSSVHSFNTILTGVYELGQYITLSVNHTLLRNGVQYSVRSRAANLLGLSDSTSNATQFVTLIQEPLPSSTSISSEGGIPLWIIILAGVIPGLGCFMLVIMIILISTLSRKFKRTKKGYPITSATEKTEPYAPPENGHIQKYFSTPLVPRAPTLEPSVDITSFHSMQELDSDSDTTQSGMSPRYKYVVSPTPSEIGIKGYVGSAPGSGTYVYV